MGVQFQIIYWLVIERNILGLYQEHLHAKGGEDVKDSLMPIDERSFKGAYYTPLQVVDEVYELLEQALGKNWQKEYIAWDMCCGAGNLEVKHSNPRNIFKGTLDRADINVMKAAKTRPSTVRFECDYLYGDIDDFGGIDCSLTSKIPQALRQVIKDGKKILALIDLPYGEVGNKDSISGNNEHKSKAAEMLTDLAQLKSNKDQSKENVWK